MLRLIVPGNEVFHEDTATFESFDDVELELEHSLVSLSKWESKYKKPFLSSNQKTTQEVFSYIEAMILTPVYPPDIVASFTQTNFNQIHDYIESAESATTFGAMPERKGKGEVITAELIYYWMVIFNIPFECELWHLNRLFALIRICNIKQSKPKKMSRTEIAMRNRELNAKRKEQYHTRG